MRLFKDQLHRQLRIKSTPERIISLVPSLTELLIDLDLEIELVGITKFCIHPAQLRAKKEIIGGTKSVNYEKIKALAPDLIIANKEENTAEMIDVLQTIAPVYVSDITHLAEMQGCISDLAILTNRVEIATHLISEMNKALINFKRYMQDIPRQKVLYFIWHKPWMVVGQDNFINTVLELNHFDNIIADKRYPEIDLKTVETADLDLILLSSEPFPFTEAHKKLFSNFTGVKLRLVDGEFFSWYGSRFTKALAYFQRLHEQNVN